MARKNNTRSEATSSAIHFDASTKTVMAEATHENIKEKVLAVREVVPGKSNNEVILVLQYYDYSVERTIQAYLEDGAKEALQEWNFTGSKQPNKKRKNKKKSNGVVSGGTNNEQTDTVPSPQATGDATPQDNILSTEAGISSKDSLNDASSSSPSVPAAEPNVQQDQQSKGRGNSVKGHHQRSQHTNNQRHHRSRERTVSEVSASSSVTDAAISKRPFQGLEKAIKDLHRQTTSLERLRNLLDHEIDRSYRSVKSVFQELQQGLTNREAQLYEEMNKLKKEASEMLELRQGKAADLRRQVDRAERLTDSEVSELRAEIKHFVSERRHDEEFGRTTRFFYDSDHLLAEISKFGEVVPVKSVPAARRESTSSVPCSEGDTNEADDQCSQEINELQDRIKSSLKLQTLSSPRTSSSTQNGAIETDFIPSRNRRRPGNFRQGNENRQQGAESKDVRTDQGSSSSKASPREQPEKRSNHRTDHDTPSGHYYTSNSVRPGENRGRGRGGGGYRGQRQSYNKKALRDAGSSSTSLEAKPISVLTLGSEN